MVATAVTEILKDLPPVFTVGQFQDGLGTRDPLSVLAEAAEEQLVLAGAQDRWAQVPPRPEDPVKRSWSFPDPGRRIMSRWRLEALWGNEPRRLSHRSGQQMKCIGTGAVFYASGPPADADAADRLWIKTYLESSETLFVAAEHLSGPNWAGPNWISTPARALLEYAHESDTDHSSMTVILHIAEVLFCGSIGKPSEVKPIADRLGLHDALRKIRSIAQAMRSLDDVFPRIYIPEGMVSESYRGYLENPPEPDTTEWINIEHYPYNSPGWKPGWYDEHNRVSWWTDPEGPLEDLLR